MNHQCRACGRQFVLHADHRVIGEDQRAMVERLHCEKISLHSMRRAVGVNFRWPIGFIVFMNFDWLNMSWGSRRGFLLDVCHGGLTDVHVL
jgi:hypothetical protein